MTFGLAAAIRSELSAADAITFPATRWQGDPLGFVHTILGQGTWERQEEMILAARDHDLVTTSAGRKVSKSRSIANIALWIYCCFPDAAIVIMSRTARQVDEILWKEVRQAVAGSGRCLACKAADPHGPRPCPHSAIIPERPGQLARTGLKSEDFRSIVGYTAGDVVAAQGTSGHQLVYLVDEASGLPDAIFHALEGNCAGGGRILLFGNPNKSNGYFYRSRHDTAMGYHRIRISSEESPNVVAGRTVIPGLCERKHLERWRAAWGVTSALYKIHVLGEDVEGEDGKILTAGALEESKARWDDTPEDGILCVGLDPAGDGGDGDESAFAVRRGLKMLALEAFRGLDVDLHLAHLLRIIDAHRKEREVPRVIVDRDGSIGDPLYRVLLHYSRENPTAFVLYGVKGSHLPYRGEHKERYGRQRDALWGNLQAWLVSGGAILDDEFLEADLHAPSWTTDHASRLKVTPKPILRKEEHLGRSPDRGDALTLAVWEPRGRDDVVDELPARPIPGESRGADPDLNRTAEFYAGGDWAFGR